MPTVAKPMLCYKGVTISFVTITKRHIVAFSVPLLDFLFNIWLRLN